MKKKNIVILALFLVAIVAVVILLVVLMKGETKTTGQNPANVKGESLVCESNAISYPLFTYDNSSSKNMKITVTSYDDSINAISFSYTLYYGNSSQVEACEAHNHAAMNISYGKNGLGADSYNTHYVKLDDAMRMELYATSSDIDEKAAKYFMINTDNNKDSGQNNKSNAAFLGGIEDLRKNYVSQGFTCKLNS